MNKPPVVAPIPATKALKAIAKLTGMGLWVNVNTQYTARHAHTTVHIGETGSGALIGSATHPDRITAILYAAEKVTKVHTK